MKMKRFIITISILLALFTMGCIFFPQADARIKISITDKPDANYEKVWITFGSISVSQAGGGADTESSWLEINSDGGKLDLLALNNGKLAELGVKDLSPGKYTQIRLMITAASVEVNGTEYNATVSSDTIKLIKPFTLQSGITTELVVDFDAAHSVNHTGSNQYKISPVVKVIQKDLTGAIKGTVTSPVDANTTVTVSAYTDYTTGTTQASVAGTVTDENGTFLLGFLEEGTYDIVIEALGYTSQVIQEKAVTVGNVLELNETISLTASN